MNDLSVVGIPLDPREAEIQKAERERRLNTVQIPLLRLFGMTFLSGGILLHNTAILGTWSWGEWLRATAVLEIYALVSWALLHLLFVRLRPFDLGIAFLVADMVMWTFAIYSSGAEKSWLFFILILRPADQTNTTFRRALTFAHLSALAYLGMLLWVRVIDGRMLVWFTEMAKLVSVYGGSLYIAFAARPAEQRRQRTAAAVRMARAAIVALRERSRQLEEARGKAEQASQAKSYFLASMSHELRTPLNAIIGFSQLLVRKADPAPTPTEAGYLAIVLKTARQLLQMVNDILDLSRIEMGRDTMKWAAVEVEALLREVVTESDLSAREKAVALSVEVPGPLPPVRADRGKLKQVVSNLVGNALKFTDDGGQVSVSAVLGPEALRVCVADTGIGIPPQDQERIFRPFEQGDPAFTRKDQGLGVGLALARRLVELHGGRIWVESEGIAGRGSRFTFTLPLDPTGP